MLMILKIIKGRGRSKYNEIESSLLEVCLISPFLLMERTELVRFVRKPRIRPLVSRWKRSRCGVSWVISILFVQGWGGAGAEMWRFMSHPYFRISLPFLTFSNSWKYFLIGHSLLMTSSFQHRLKLMRLPFRLLQVALHSSVNWLNFCLTTLE